MAKRNLLLCFDAFGTLFRIRQPIEHQYGEVARRCFGLTGFTDDQLRTTFRAAFKAEAKRHPNYGRTSRLGATAWWTNVIHETFRPLLAGDVPAGLAPRLLDRFASGEGYTAAPQLPQLLGALRTRQRRYGRVVVGVITNSDDRVPGILASFGLRVSPLRYGGPAGSHDALHTEPNAPYDIDFHCMSYDVGVEKPDPRIFHAAESMLPAALAVGGDTASLEGDDLSSWDRLYVGDEIRKDVGGAQAAGWYPVLLLDDSARHQLQQQQQEEEEGGILPHELHQLRNCPPQSLALLFDKHPVVGVDSIASLVHWMVSED